MNRRWNIVFMSVGIIAGACKYIWGGLGISLGARALGLEHIPAILLSEAIFFAIVSVLAGVNNGYGVLIAKAARENETECRRLIRNGFGLTILISIGVTVICMLCKRTLISLFVDSTFLHYVTQFYFERWIFIIPLASLYSYIMVLFRATGNFKTPCLFIVCAVLVDIGMTRGIMLYMVDSPYIMLSIATAKVCLNILLFLIAYTYFRMKYPNLCRGKVSTKLNWSAWGNFFKSGIVTGVLGLPLTLMILWESKMFAESSAYYYLYLLLGALIMAPFMAKLLVGKYSEN